MKILIIQQRYGIGDMVIFLPYIHAISKKFNTPISLLAKESSKASDLLGEDKHVDEIITLDKEKDGVSGFFKLSNELKKRKFDKVFIFNSSLRYNWISKFCKIRSYQYPLAFRSKKDVIFHSAKVFTESVTGKIVSTQPKIYLSEKTIQKAKEKYKFDKNVCHIVLGISASGKTKIVETEIYIRLAESLSQNKKCKFYIAAGKNDQSLINKILNSKVGKDCISFSNLSIKDTLPIIKHADLFCGNDSGFLHISSGLNIKCLGLFVDSPAYSYSAYSNKIEVIVPEGETIETTTHDTLGRDRISFDKILSKANQMLF